MSVTLPAKSQVASFDVDAQNTFTPVCPDELPVPQGDEIVAALNAQAEFASVRIGSKDAHSPKAAWLADDANPQYSTIEGENMDVRWVAHAMVGTQGFDLITGLPPVTDYDYFVWKGVECDMHPYGACYHDFAEKLSTGAIEFLRGQGITTVIVGGLATDYCVKSTVLQLVKAGFAVIVNLTACRGIAPDTTQAAIDEMQQAGAVCIEQLDQLTTAE
ncbi:MAG: nicotinamidase [Legionellales bacterium]|nr:nicotinamidase [Legionellales bacterium]|tara:strand:+ start:9845 stop:10495 length:651 start_codon:yes stop_codon:yes gene_type:complete